MDEFERGDEVQVEYELDAKFGKRVHTATVSAQKQGATSKKMKTNDSDFVLDNM